jgi:hypothetical protein
MEPEPMEPEFRGSWFESQGDKLLLYGIIAVAVLIIIVLIILLATNKKKGKHKTD